MPENGPIVLLAAAFTAAVSWGAIAIPFGEVWTIMLQRGLHMNVGHHADATHANIVWTLRAPRAVLAGLVGSGLSLAGMAAQALARNPLADPYVLGVSSGASLKRINPRQEFY